MTHVRFIVTAIEFKMTILRLVEPGEEFGALSSNWASLNE